MEWPKESSGISPSLRQRWEEDRDLFACVDLPAGPSRDTWPERLIATRRDMATAYYGEQRHWTLLVDRLHSAHMRDFK